MTLHMTANIFIQIMEAYVIIQVHRLGATFKLEALTNACHLTDNHA
jgi:hypothetical protein